VRKIDFGPIQINKRVDSVLNNYKFDYSGEIDTKKIGIYTQKEAKREFKWFKDIEGMDFILPNITKKINGKNIEGKDVPSYTETVFIKKGEIARKSKNKFVVPTLPIEKISKGKIVAFTGSEIIIEITKNKPKFGIIIPVSQDLQLSVKSDEANESNIEEYSKTLQEIVGATQKSINIKEPILFRAESTIKITQTGNSPKQFILLTLY
jgi:hypothetical protein